MNPRSEIIEHQGTVRLEHYYSKRPSWKTCGGDDSGTAMVQVRANPKWESLDMTCAEIPEGNKGTKQVYVSVPVKDIVAVLTKIGYTIVPPKS